MPKSEKRKATKSNKTEGKSDSNFPYAVVVTMQVEKQGKKMETKKIDFGKLDKRGVDELTGLFSMMATNIEEIRKLSPVFERLDRSRPQYVG